MSKPSYLKLVRAEGLSLREVALRFSRPQRDVVGLPEQVAGLFRTEYAGHTLRSNFGLEVSANRYSVDVGAHQEALA